MKRSELMWNIFLLTGNVGIYLLYKNYLKEEWRQEAAGRECILDSQH
jgi:hypothetical protein